MKIDLHLHTCYSDGGFSPEDIICDAIKKNIQVISFTDHNFATCKNVHYTNNSNMKIITGVEISAQYMLKEVHILAYNFDDSLNQFLNEIRKKIIKKHLSIVNILSTNYSDISVGDFLDFKFDKYAGGWKLLHYLYTRNVINSPNDYDKLISKIMTYDHLPKIKNVIKEIENSGGKSFLAHPTLYGLVIKDSFIKECKKLGFNGIECFHPDIPLQKRLELIKLSKKYDLQITGGSDYHKDFNNRRIGFPLMILRDYEMEWVYELI